MKHKRAEDLGEGICPFQLTSNFKNPSPHPLARNRSDRLSVRSQPPPLKVLGSVRTFCKPLFLTRICVSELLHHSGESFQKDTFPVGGFSGFCMFKNRKVSLIWWPFLLNTKIIKNVCVKRNILCTILLQPKEQFVILRSVPKLSFGTFLLEYYNNTNESHLFPHINSKVVCEPVSYEYFTKAFKQKTYT